MKYIFMKQKVEDGTEEDGWSLPVVVHISSQCAHILQLNLLFIDVLNF